MAKTWFDVGQLSHAITLAVRFTDRDGTAHGPFKLRFDPLAEEIRTTRASLTEHGARWVDVIDVSGKQPNAYFSLLLWHRPAFRAIHYGFDTKRPETNLFLRPDQRRQERAARPELRRSSEGRAVHLGRHRVQGRLAPEARIPGRQGRPRMSKVAIVHSARHFSTGNAVRRELELGGVPGWFGSRDLLAGAATLDGQRDAIDDASIVVVVVPDATPYPREIDEALGAARRGRCVIPIAAGAEQDPSPEGAFWQGISRIRGVFSVVFAPPPTPTKPSLLAASVASKNARSVRPQRVRRAAILIGAAAIAGALLGGALAVAPSTLGIRTLPVLSSIARPAGPSVALSATLGVPGWTVQLHLRESARRIEYRTSSRVPFTSTGDDRAARDPSTLEPVARTSFLLPDSTGKTAIEVRYVDLSGNTRGPYSVLFDPLAEAIAAAHTELEQPARRWATVTRAPDRRIYLTSLFAHRLALRAIRYGVDVARPDHVIAIVPNATGKMEDRDQSEIAIPESARSLVLELEYRDGTRSGTRSFQLDQIRGSGGWIIDGRALL